jgi:glyceraldehyde 3-phosphate dehydrogenase
VRKTRIFINGFGRIGRVALRIALEDPMVEVVGINDIYDFQQMGALFQYDSIYGRYHDSVSVEKDRLYIGERVIKLYAIKEPSQLKLQDVDVLLQCTGIFLGKEENRHYLNNGVKKVLISAPAAEEIPTYIMDVNHQSYQGERIISNSSCSANAILPIFSILESTYGIRQASMSMFHSYTAYQKLLDVKHYSKDIRRSRSATQNIQPLESSAAKECEKFFPHLKGSLYAKSIRVPVAATTLYDLTIKLKEKTDNHALEKLFREKSSHQFKEILHMRDTPTVSTDIIRCRYGAVIDRELTQILEGDFIKLYAWQDNEYGYAYQLLRVAKYIVKPD